MPPSRSIHGHSRALPASMLFSTSSLTAAAGPLHHLARGDLPDHLGGQLPEYAGASIGFHLLCFYSLQRLFACRQEQHVQRVHRRHGQHVQTPGVSSIKLGPGPWSNRAACSVLPSCAWHPGCSSRCCLLPLTSLTSSRAMISCARATTGRGHARPDAATCTPKLLSAPPGMILRRKITSSPCSCTETQ